MEATSKITARHLNRNAYLYVRQSTIRQVVENAESTKRQYDLRQRATTLGWSDEQIQVIDCDLGESGASTTRDGFRSLVTEVSLGRAGIVMGLEVSRLARNSSDWHRLLDHVALVKKFNAVKPRNLELPLRKRQVVAADNISEGRCEERKD